MGYGPETVSQLHGHEESRGLELLRALKMALRPYGAWPIPCRRTPKPLEPGTELAAVCWCPCAGHVVRRCTFLFIYMSNNFSEFQFVLLLSVSYTEFLIFL